MVFYKNIVTVLVTFIALPSYEALASVQNLLLEIQCKKELRSVWGKLEAKIDLEKGHLSYEMEKMDVNEPTKTFKIKGSNGTGFSVFHSKYVTFGTSLQYQLRITAVESFYSRPIEPIKRIIQINLVKTSKDEAFLGEYQLSSFTVNGKVYELKGAYCHLSQI